MSESDADTFCTTLEGVLHDLHYLELNRLRLSKDGGIAISFDGGWQPFVGHTLGYNNSSKPPRLPISSLGRVLEVSRVWLEEFGRPQPGGRVLIYSDRVLCDGHTLGTWQWDAEDPVRRIQRFYDSVEKKRRDEEVSAASDACREAKLRELQGDPGAAELLLLAKQHLQRIDQNSLFDVICGTVDALRESTIQREVDAARKACLLARHREQQGDPTTAEYYWSSAREHLRQVNREGELDEMRRSVDQAIESQKSTSESERRTSPINVRIVKLR